MSDSVVDPVRRYPCVEGSTPARIYLKRGTAWPLREGMKVLYKKSESASAHWMGALVTKVGDDEHFVLQPA